MLRYANFFLILLLAYPFDGYALEMEREEILQRPAGLMVEHIFWNRSQSVPISRSPISMSIKT